MLVSHRLRAAFTEEPVQGGGRGEGAAARGGSRGPKASAVEGWGGMQTIHYPLSDCHEW